VSLTVREAAAVNTLLHWLLGDQVDGVNERPDAYQASVAAELLADSAYAKLAAGINPADIRTAQFVDLGDVL
jgi:hypothetical protein